MKNLFLSFIAIGFVIIACKKNAVNNTITTDSATLQNTDSYTADSTAHTINDSIEGRDSINTKTHIGGRKTSNINTANGNRNVNAAVSDTAHSAR